MTGPVTTEALVEGSAEPMTEAEIAAIMAEDPNYPPCPAPPPIPVRERYYLTECEHCGWVGSSEQCGGDAYPGDDDIVCPVCCSSIGGDSPNEADTAKHGEAVYQRIVTAEAERDAALAALQQVTAERDEARDLAYELKLAAAGGEDVPGSANLVTVEDVRRWQDEYARLVSAATSELARLRAEGEAKDRALKILLPFVDYAAGEGLAFVETEDGEHPEMDAADIMAAAAEALGLELGSDAYLALLPTGYDAIRAARAATAREG